MLMTLLQTGQEMVIALTKGKPRDGWGGGKADGCGSGDGEGIQIGTEGSCAGGDGGAGGVIIAGN